MTETRAAGETFFDNANLLRQIQRFQDEVEQDPLKFEPGVLARFEVETTAYGRQQLNTMHRVLVARDFGAAGPPRRLAGILEANRDRYVGLWERNVANGFAAAASSIPDRTRLGTRTLVRRIFDFFARRDGEEAAEQVVPGRVRDDATLHGIVRTALVDGRRRVWRQRLVPYLKMLFRTYPMNFLRDYTLILARADIDPGDPGEEVFFISAGQQHNSSPVCIQCQGRAITRSALRIVTRDLQSPLYHPNCRHRILKKGATVNSYDGSHGPLITPEEVVAWLRAGKVKKARRPNRSPVNI
jgi:hypothetical protein